MVATTVPQKSLMKKSPLSQDDLMNELDMDASAEAEVQDVDPASAPAASLAAPRSRPRLDLVQDLKMLGQYRSDIQSQRDKDLAFEDAFRSGIDKLRGSQVSDEQLEDIGRRKNVIQTIANMFGSMGNNFYTNKGVVPLGPAPQLVAQQIEKYKEIAGRPLETAKIKRDNAIDLLNQSKVMADVQRHNLQSRGQDINQYELAGDRSLKIQDTIDTDDPNSEKSAKGVAALRARIDAARQRAMSESPERRARYYNLYQTYDKIGQLLQDPNTTYRDVERYAGIMDKAETEAKDRVKQDIDEQGQEMKAKILGATLGKGDFDQRNKLSEIAEKVDNTKQLAAQYDELVRLAKDPEIRLGLGSQLESKILDWTGDLTPKQARFRDLMTMLSIGPQHDMYASTLTGNEMAQGIQWLPRENDSLTSFLAKTEGLDRTNMELLYRSNRRHFNLATGKNFDTVFGVNRQPGQVGFNPGQRSILLSYDPYNYSVGRAAFGGGATVKEIESKKGSKGQTAAPAKQGTPAPKTMDAKIKEYATKAGITEEQARKELEKLYGNQ